MTQKNTRSGKISGRPFLLFLWLALLRGICFGSPQQLAALKPDQMIADLQVSHLYAGSDQQLVGAKFQHKPTGAPIYFFQIETVPQVFMWVDTPPDSDKGLAHSLEHLLGGKGTKGRYVRLLNEMRLSESTAATTDDFNLYSFSSGTGITGFFEQFHAWLEALYKPDFTNLEAEREFYHFGVSSDVTTTRKFLVEKGSVYDEMLTGQGRYKYYFELNKRIFGNSNPFGFYNGGVPEEMRQVTPNDIRRFYAEHYHLGPATGFIFILNPKEDAVDFLRHVSQELNGFSNSSPRREIGHALDQPKYPVEPANNREIGFYRFPSSSENDQGEVRFGWKSIKTDSQTELRLLQLFFRALADGEQSILYRSLVDRKTRELDSAATNLESLVFLENSPHFPAEFIGLSGIPGKQITLDRVEQIRSHISGKISEVYNYPDNSRALLRFNRLVKAQLKTWRRAQGIWTRSAPRFGANYDTEWKEYLDYLEMDPAFVRSISDDRVWNDVNKELRSGKNVWRDVVQKFHLLDVPYATASVPSPQTLEEMELARERRIEQKIKQLMDRFASNDQQQALTRFEEEEAAKTKEIDKIAVRVDRPKFTEHPPLTPDPDVRYNRLRLEGAPTIATFFDRAPTIDLGLSFDLRKIPPRYYKYLPILPRTLDSLGLKTSKRIVPYADLLAQTRSEINDFSIKYEFNPASLRADLTIRASTTTPDEFRGGLALIRHMINSNYLEISNVERLRDLVDKRLGEEDAYDKGGDDYWFVNPIYAFRYQNDPLYVALSSVFTKEHSDARLRWLLHKQVTSAAIEKLGNFAAKILTFPSGTSPEDVSEKLSKVNARGLEGELVEYWQRNIESFPESDLIPGLRNLTTEVQEDLRTGPIRAIAEISDLQRLVLDRGALNIDLTLDKALLRAVQPALADFVRSLPTRTRPLHPTEASITSSNFIMAKLEKRYHLPGNDAFPWYIGFEDSRSATASMLFLADHPAFSNLDRKSLLEVLSSKMVSGTGPHTFFTKTQEDGLAYATSISGDPAQRLISYYAGRSPDIVSLIELVNSIAAKLPALQDAFLIDYALQETFPLPRSMSTFSERGSELAHDIRDGNEPDKIRRFSEAVLRMRQDSDLLSELTQSVLYSIGPVLVQDKFKAEQRAARSVFFFVGPDRLLSDAEKRLGLPKLLRIYSSDFWLEFSDNSGDTATTKSHAEAAGQRSLKTFHDYQSK